MRVKLSSLQPSQLLPNFKIGQPRLPAPGVQQRAIHGGSITSAVLGSSSAPVNVPNSSSDDLSPKGNGKTPLPSNANEGTSAGNPQTLQSPQASSTITSSVPPTNTGPDNNALFKVPFPPGFNRTPSQRNLPTSRQNLQQPPPSSPLQPVPAAPTQQLIRPNQNELNSLVRDLSNSGYNSPSVASPSRDFPSASFNNPTVVSPVRDLPSSSYNSPPVASPVRDLPSVSYNSPPVASPIRDLPSTSYNSPSVSPVRDFPSSSHSSPSASSPVIKEVPRPSSPLYPIELFQKSGSNSPDLQIVLDNRPLPPFKSLKSRPAGATYATITLPDGSKGYQVDTEGTDQNSNSQYFVNSPTQNLPNGFRQILPAPAEVRPSSSTSTNTIAQLFPNLNVRTQPSQQGSSQNLLPTPLGRSVLQSPGAIVPANTGQYHSIQGLLALQPNKPLESHNSYRNEQFYRELQPQSPFQTINSPAEIVPPRSQQPSSVLTGALQPNAGQMTQYAPSYQAQLTRNTMDLRSYLSSPPLSALKSRQQLPVRISPATNNINTRPNGLNEQLIFPQSAIATQDLRFNNQSQFPNHGQVSQYPMGQTPPNIFQQATFPQNINTDISRTPTYFQQQQPSPHYPTSQSNRYHTPYTSSQGIQPERISTPFSIQGSQPERISSPFSSPQAGPRPDGSTTFFPPGLQQPERVATPYISLQGSQPKGISSPYTVQESFPQPNRIPTPYTPTQWPQHNPVSEAYSSLRGSQPNRIPETYISLQRNQPNGIPEPYSSLPTPPPSPNSPYRRFPPFISQGNSPGVQNELYKKDEYLPNKRGRFIGQTNTKPANDHQQLFRQPEYVQDYFRRLQQGQFQGQNTRVGQVNFKNANPYYDRSLLPQAQGRPRQKNKQIQPQPLDIQKQFQEIHDSEFQGLGQFQQIPPRGNQAGGQYQQLQPSNPPSRPLPFQQGFSGPFINQGLQTPSRSFQNPPFNAEPFGYRGQQFSTGQNFQRGLVQGNAPCTHSQTPQYPSQEGPGLWTNANNGQNGPIQTISPQRTPTTSLSIPAYNKPAESLAPNSNSNLYGIKKNLQAGDTNLQPSLPGLARYSSPASNDDQSRPNSGANQFPSAAIELFNDSSPGTVVSQPNLPNSISNNGITVFPDVNINTQSRTDVGAYEISTSRPPNIETFKEPQDASFKNTPEAASSILPHHRGEMPFYSQSEVDSHHRRMLENNKTKEDSEFESDPTILQWYLQRAKQVLRQPNDNNHKETGNLASKTASDGASVPNGTNTALSHATATFPNANVSPVPGAASTNSNSANGTDEFRQYTGSEAGVAAVSSADNSRGFSKSPNPFSTNVLHQPGDVGKQTSDTNTDPDLTRKHRSTSFDELYEFLMESADVNAIIQGSGI